jgi:tRNA(Ile)-lysidine synthase
VLAVAAGGVATAVHVDHGLRPGSADEARVVEETAGRLGAPFRSVTVDVSPGPNLEARARAARYAALPPDVLTGHTADDQAETVLLNLLRGAGLDGLAAIRDDGRRPLLGLRRTETHRLCGELRLPVVEDPSNLDRSLRRNRVRHELIPLLDAIAERDVAAVLARQASLLADDAAYLDDLAAELDPVDARALAVAPLPLARRAVRRWLRGVAGGPECHPPDAAAVDRVLQVARGEVRATEVSGHSIRRRAGRLTITTE